MTSEPALTKGGNSFAEKIEPGSIGIRGSKLEGGGSDGCCKEGPSGETLINMHREYNLSPPMTKHQKKRGQCPKLTFIIDKLAQL